MDRFARHIAACNNIASPAGFLGFHMGGVQVGFVTPELARAISTSISMVWPWLAG